MANKTVYPYGTGGSLPSSIGLIDDFYTGGVDKALTAEAGKRLFNETHTITTIDISSIIEVSAFIAMTTNKWVVNYQQYKCKFLPVRPGETYCIKANDDAACGIAVLTNNEYTSGSVPSYATGWSIVYFAKGTYKEFSIPDNGEYLYIATNSDPYGTFIDISPDLIQLIEYRGGDADNSEIMKYDLDLDAYTPIRAFLAADNKWVTDSQNYPYYSIFIPCDPRQEFTLTPNPGYSMTYAFLKSDEHVNQTTPQYASGYSGNGVIVNDGSIANVVAPGDANFLYVVTGYSVAGVILNRPKSIRTTGDTVEEIARAVVGKAPEVDAEGIPVGLIKHEYNGPLVTIEEKHNVATAQVSTITSIACQGGACFGDYLFMFTENNTTCWLYNLATKTLLQTIAIPSRERGFVGNCHCNTVNFGTEYYDANDPFPLIYVSTGYASGGYTGALVYRVVATTENNATTYSLTLVQTLKMPGEGWTEFVVGEDGYCYLCYTTPRTIYKMKMPKLSDGDITFDLEQAITTYQFTRQPSWYNGSRNQNRMYHNGKIYVVSGVPAASETSLFIVLDLATETREVEIDLVNTLGLTSESETCFIWQGHICVAFRNNANVYALYFE